MKVFVKHISFLFLSSYGVMLINQFGMYSGTAHSMLQLRFPAVFTQRFVLPLVLFSAGTTEMSAQKHNGVAI